MRVNGGVAVSWEMEEVGTRLDKLSESRLLSSFVFA